MVSDEATAIAPTEPKPSTATTVVPMTVFQRIFTTSVWGLRLQNWRNKHEEALMYWARARREDRDRIIEAATAAPLGGLRYP